jgi:hypothetical protein
METAPADHTEGDSVHSVLGHRRPVYVLALAGLTAFAAGCSSLGESTTASDATPAAAASSAATTGSSGDPGCDQALSDVSRYGPSTVKLLADGREAVTKAAVSLLVDGLDGAADAAGTPQTKQAIHTLATAYDDYFDLTTDAVSIPLSTLLKDTADLEVVCH